MSVIDVLLPGVLGLVAAVLAIVLHEVGHLLCGWLSGYRLVMFHVLFVRIYRESGRWRTALGFAGGPISGQCMMEPVVPEERFRYRLSFAGGFLMNFVLAAICGVLLLAFDTGVWARDFLMIFAVVNVIIVLFNAIPMSLGVTNDAADLLDVMRSRCRGRDLYRGLRINAFLAADGKIKDIDAALVASPIDPPCECAAGRIRMMVEAQRMDSQGEHAQASQILNGLLAHEKATLQRANLLSSILYNHLVYGVDSVPVPDPSDPALAKIFKLKLPGVYQMKAAISYYLEHDQAKALKELDEAERTLPALGGAGSIAEAKDEIDMLRARFTAEVSPVNDTVTQPGDKVSD